MPVAVAFVMAVCLLTGAAPIPALCVVFMMCVFVYSGTKAEAAPFFILALVILQIYLLAPLIKVASLEPLQDGILHSDEVFFVSLVFCLGAAAYVALISRVNRPGVLHEPVSATALSRLSTVALVIGGAAVILNLMLGDKRGETESVKSIGLFYKYMSFLILPLIVYFYNFGKEKSYVLTRNMIAAISLIAFTMLAMNARKLSVDAVFASALAYWAGGHKIRLKFVVPLLLGAVFVLGPVSDIVTRMRFDVISMPVDQRVQYVWDHIGTYVSEYLAGEGASPDQIGGLSAEYLDYIGRNTWAQRLSGHQMLGYTYDRLPEGVCPVSPIFFGISQALPAGIGAAKVGYSFGDAVTWQMGLRINNVIGYPFFPLLPSTVTCYGSFWGLALSLALFALVVGILSIVVPRVKGSMWGVFFVVVFYNHIIEGEAVKYIYLILRMMPEYILVSLIISAWVRRADRAAAG